MKRKQILEQIVNELIQIDLVDYSLFKKSSTTLAH